MTIKMGTKICITQSYRNHYYEGEIYRVVGKGYYGDDVFVKGRNGVTTHLLAYEFEVLPKNKEEQRND